MVPSLQGVAGSIALESFFVFDLFELLDMKVVASFTAVEFVFLSCVIISIMIIFHFINNVTE